jgi:hypothetical protein
VIVDHLKGIPHYEAIKYQVGCCACIRFLLFRFKTHTVKCGVTQFKKSNKQRKCLNRSSEFVFFGKTINDISLSNFVWGRRSFVVKGLG